jgi:hypothetical protein
MHVQRKRVNSQNRKNVARRRFFATFFQGVCFGFGFAFAGRVVYLITEGGALM